MKKLLVGTLFILFSISSQARPLEVMTYNLENLFDTYHDEHHEDFEYLPFGHPAKEEGCSQIDNSYYRGKCFRNNWDMQQFNSKVRSVVEVIRREGRELPDVLTLVEIESERALRVLADELGYEHFYVTDGLDKRGINVGVLINLRSDLNIVSFEEIELDETRLKKPTRNILEVTLQYGSEILKIYVNHWPSQNNPTSDRMFAAKILEEKIVANNSKNYKTLVVGDLNVRNSERPNPINDALIGGRSNMSDVEESFRSNSRIPVDLKNSMPPSSYFYKRGNEWTHLDRIIAAPSLIDGQGLEVDLPTYEIYAHPNYSTKVSARGAGGKTYETRKPVRFNYQGNGRSVGASDHFPVSVKLSF